MSRSPLLLGDYMKSALAALDLPQRQPVAFYRPVLSWIEANPGQHGKAMPRRLREFLRGAEDANLIEWGLQEGWGLTKQGFKALRSVN